jgi:hypothetical protein
MNIESSIQLFHLDEIIPRRSVFSEKDIPPRSFVTEKPRLSLKNDSDGVAGELAGGSWAPNRMH